VIKRLFKEIKQGYLKFGCFLFTGISALLFAGSAEAVQDIGGVAKQVTTSFGALARLITAGAYLAGLGFAIGAIMKFKQHKDNPTQIPIGTPIALLFISAALLFLPTILGVTQQTLFGTEGTVAGPTGIIFGAS